MEKFLNVFLTNYLPNIIIAIIILVLGWWLSNLLCKIIKKALLKSRVDNAVVTFLMSFIKIALRFIVIISTLATLGINVTSIITALGAAAVTVGLALQSSMSNIASGVLIIINKPFKAGDLLEFEGNVGTVVKIELFNTYLQTPDSKQIIIPNSRLTSNNVINVTSLDNRRLDLSYTISYEDSIAKAKGVIFSLISQCPAIDEGEMAPIVCVGQHKASGIEIVVRAWVKPDAYWDAYYFMQENVKLKFDECGITIPYEQIVVHQASKSIEK